MTIRNDWCASCEQASSHAVICTTCGATLTSRPPASIASRVRTPLTAEPQISLIPEHIVQQVNASNLELTTMLADLRRQLSDLRAQTVLAQNGMSVARGIEDLRGLLPPEAFDPQQARGVSRGTAKKTLENLHRMKVDEHSSVLTQATLTLPSGGPQFHAVLGEFGPPLPHSWKGTRLVVASPKSGNGGLSHETCSKANGSILYMERGDGLTFVKKAIMAQEIGAVAVIIGNNTSEPWPYIMRDSNGEAKLLSLRIPVAMIKESDGQVLIRQCQSETSTFCDLDIQSISKECIICCEELSFGQTILRLPACGHLFHEKCALTWLTEHNSCPFCRRQLPTDDPVYEAERRRTQSTHAGYSGVAEGTNGDSFYG